MYRKAPRSPMAIARVKHDRMESEGFVAHAGWSAGDSCRAPACYAGAETAANAFSAARSVDSTCSSPWAPETKPVSNADGAR